MTICVKISNANVHVLMSVKQASWTQTFFFIAFKCAKINEKFKFLASILSGQHVAKLAVEENNQEHENVLVEFAQQYHQTN